MTTTTKDPAINAALALLDAELLDLCGEGLNSEQRECLLDPDRYHEALEMLDDMEERICISGYVRGKVGDALNQRDVA